VSKRTIVVGVLALALAAIGATSAAAKDGDVRARGTCTGSATARLKLSEEDGRIEVEFEVDQNRNGVTWQVALFRNGHRFARTQATTRAPSGSFEVRRLATNGAGADTIRGRAVSPSGQVCTARATF
jgi:hypothetical protein